MMTTPDAMIWIAITVVALCCAIVVMMIEEY